MNAGNIFNSVLALVFVLCLIGLLSIVLKRYGGVNFASTKSGVKRRLQIRESLSIDAKKKIVIISCDDREHLLAFNESKIEVIETNINNINEKIS